MFEKNNPTINLNVLYVKKEHISCLHIETQLKSWGANDAFNDSKRRRMTISFSKKLSALLKGITPKDKLDFYYLNTFIFLEQKTSLNLIKRYAKIKAFVLL